MGDLLAEIAPPPPKIQGSALFARQRTIRREIRRWWVPRPIHWAAWLMLNPSDAAEERNDPTAQRVTHFSRAWGYDGWIGINLYPFVSSTPAEMWRWADWQNNGADWSARDDLAANLDDIERVGREASLRVVAFGAAPVERDEVWLDQCLEAFSQPSDIGAGEHLLCLGTSKNGQPLHPMARGKWRVPDDRRPTAWDGWS